MGKSALLVIDIQKDNNSKTDPYPFPIQDVQGPLQNIDDLSYYCKNAGIPAFFIRQTFDGFLGKRIFRLFLKGITGCGSG